MNTSLRTAVVLLAALGTLSLAVPDAAAQSWRTVTMSRQRADEERVDVEVAYGAGRLRIGPAEKGLLYRMHLRYDEERFEPRAEYRRGRLRLGVETVNHHFRFGKDHAGELELELSRELPMDLELEFGAVRADVDLGGLHLTDLDLATGASESRLDVSSPNPGRIRTATLEVGAADFTARHLGNLNAERIDVSAGVGDVTLELTGDWRRDAEVDVEMGLGSLELRFPRDVGVEFEKRTFLTSFDAEGLERRGDTYYSENWETAERRISVEVEAAFGSVRVVWVR